jgi:sulfopyruvate decarboxylase TPP-binding subunit
MMFSGEEIAAVLADLGVTHVVWLPDSALGPWEAALETSRALTLLRVCREGEAWPLAAGLHLGGKSPLLMMQVTGFFESGDALRNVLFDLKLPIFAILGARSWLVKGSRDSAKRFTSPILDAWGIDRVVIERPEDKPKLADHYRRCRSESRPGAALIAEGRM